MGICPQCGFREMEKNESGAAYTIATKQAQLRMNATLADKNRIAELEATNAEQVEELVTAKEDLAAAEDRAAGAAQRIEELESSVDVWKAAGDTNKQYTDMEIRFKNEWKERAETAEAELVEMTSLFRQAQDQIDEEDDEALAAEADNAKLRDACEVIKASWYRYISDGDKRMQYGAWIQYMNSAIRRMEAALGKGREGSGG